MSTEQEIQSPKAKTNWLMRLFKITFFIAAFFLVLFTIMANVGGNSDFYKETIENYFRDTTGYNAKVTKLNGVTLFPSISVSFEGLELRSAPEDDTPAATADSVNFRMGFWDVATSSGKVKALDIRGVTALPGVITRRAMLLEKLAIEENNLDQDNPSAALVAEGFVGEIPFQAHTDLEVFGSKRNRKYRFGVARNFEGSLGPISVKGALDRGVFDNVEIALNNEPVISGKFVLERSGNGTIRLYGEGILPEHRTALSPDLAIINRGGKLSVSGDLQSSIFHLEDFTGDSRLQKLIGAFDEVFGDPNNKAFTLPVDDADVDLTLKKFMLGTVNLGELNTVLKSADGALVMNLEDHFALSDMAGSLSLKAAEGQAYLDVDLKFKGFDYGELQKQFSDEAQLTGKGDAAIKLSAQSPDLSGLTKALKGSFTFVGGEGKLASNVVNLWGGGLVNALLPDFSGTDKLSVNCTIMDFTIEKGVASSNALFVDATRVTVAGEGTYNIVDDQLDITLTPKPKSIAIGDISSSVKVTGPLGRPSTGPDLRGIGRKIGGMLLGAVNPAFLAYSLTDLGLNDSHPCKPYMSDAEEILEVPAVGRSEANQ